MRQSVLIQIAVIAAALLASPAVSADVTKRELLACANEALFSKIHGYATKKEHDSVRKMLATGQCVAIPPGEQVTILRPGILTATIQYNGAKLFTAADALR